MDTREGPEIGPNTERALKADLRLFTGWCAERGAQALPARAETVAAFVDDMAGSRAPATVRRYVASIDRVHRVNGHDARLASPPVRRALARVRRSAAERRDRAAGLTWERCRQLIEASGDSLIDARNRALLAVAYDTLLRRGVLTALEVSDLLPQAPGGTVLRVRTDARNGREESVRLAPDTVRLVCAWLSASGIEGGRLFRSVAKGGNAGGPLPPGQVSRIFKAMARQAGFPEAVARRISSESPRVGAVQDVVAAGVDLPAILEAGPWKSVVADGRSASTQPGRRGGALRLVRLLQRAAGGAD